MSKNEWKSFQCTTFSSNPENAGFSRDPKAQEKNIRMSRALAPFVFEQEVKNFAYIIQQQSLVFWIFSCRAMEIFIPLG